MEEVSSQSGEERISRCTTKKARQIACTGIWLMVVASIAFGISYYLGEKLSLGEGTCYWLAIPVST